MNGQSGTWQWWKGRDDMAKNYVYWSTQRPVGIGTCPKEGMVRFYNYSCRTPVQPANPLYKTSFGAWGYVVYNRELDLHEVCDFELVFAGEEEGDDK